jgi:hypothetical protein
MIYESDWSLCDDRMKTVDIKLAKETIEEQDYLVKKLSSEMHVNQELEFYRQYTKHLIDENLKMKEKLKKIEKLI